MARRTQCPLFAVTLLHQVTSLGAGGHGGFSQRGGVRGESPPCPAVLSAGVLPCRKPGQVPPRRFPGRGREIDPLWSGGQPCLL